MPANYLIAGMARSYKFQLVFRFIPILHIAALWDVVTLRLLSGLKALRTASLLIGK